MAGVNVISLEHISEAIRNLSKFLFPLLPLASCHMVDYISSNHWETLLPERIRDDLLKLPREQLQRLPSASLLVNGVGAASRDDEWCMSTSDLPSFLSAIRRHSLKSLGVLTPIEEILRVHGPNEVTTLPMKGVMSEKKSHEVEVMSQVVTRLAKDCDVDWIIDLGSGKGYLSTSLVLQYSLNVVAIDSSQENTSSAVTRKTKLQKYWKSIRKAEEDRLLGKPVKKGKTRRRRGKHLGDRKDGINLTELTDASSSQNTHEMGRHIAVTAFITEDTDLHQILKENISNEVDNLRESTDRLSLMDGNSIESGEVCCDCNITELSETPLVIDEERENSHKQHLNTSENVQETKSAKDSEHHISRSDESPLTSQSRGPLINDKFRLGLVGLHTCGNLAPSSLKLFLSNPTVALLCNVGCCYHLIEEEFSRNPFMDNGNTKQKQSTKASDIEDKSGVDLKQGSHCINPMHPSENPNLSLGFPLSKTLRSREFALGRNSRMLSCQPADRLNFKDMNSSLALYWRSLLQVLLLQKIGSVNETAHVGRIAAKCHNFNEYARTAFTKLGLDIEIKEEELHEYDKKYGSHINKLEMFFLLRASLAPLIEGLILLDRLAFLYEQGVECSYLVQLFDPVTSPRCHALIAFRENSSTIS